MPQLLITTSEVCSPQTPPLGTSEQQAAEAEGQARQRVRNGGEAQTGLGSMRIATPAYGTLPAPKESLVITDVQHLRQLNRSVRGSGLHTKQMLRLGTCGGSQPTPEHRKRSEGYRLSPGSSASAAPRLHLLDVSAAAQPRARQGDAGWQELQGKQLSIWEE